VPLIKGKDLVELNGDFCQKGEGREKAKESACEMALQNFTRRQERTTNLASEGPS
jgi:hypothetical protein